LVDELDESWSTAQGDGRPKKLLVGAAMFQLLEM
jgi:hypothetical protein